MAHGDSALAHLAAAARWADRSGALRDSLLADARQTEGYVLRDAERWPEARDGFASAAAAIQNRLGPATLQLVVPLSELGNTLKVMGDYDAARDTIQRAIHIAEADSLHGQRYLEYALSVLGALERQLGRTSEAVEVLARVTEGTIVALARVVRSALLLRQGDALEARRLALAGAAALPAPSDASGMRAAEVAEQLYFTVRAPLAGDATALILVPEGPVIDLPWLALPTSGDRYLADAQMDLRVLPAERDLLQTAAVRQGTGLLALGDPSFDAAAGAVGRPDALERALRSVPGVCRGGGVRLRPLPGARAEAQDVAARWAEVGAGGARVLLGPDASERAFRREAPGRRAIHIATRGVLLSDSCGEASGTRGVGGVEPLVSTRRRPRRTVVAEASPPRRESPWLEREVWLALGGVHGHRGVIGTGPGSWLYSGVIHRHTRSPMSLRPSALALALIVSSAPPPASAATAPSAEVWAEVDSLAGAGRLADAEQRVLGILRTPLEQSGLDSLQWAAGWYRVAAIRLNTKSYADSLPLEAAERCLGVVTRHLAIDDERLAKIELVMGGLLRETGHASEAVKHYAHALDIRGSRLGPSDLDVADVWIELADCQIVANDTEGALASVNGMLDGLARRADHQDRRIGDGLAVRAACERRQLRDEEAQADFEQGIERLERAGGEWDPGLVRPLVGLAGLARDQHDYPRALLLFRRAAEVGARHGGADDPGAITARYNVALVRMDLGELAEARAGMDSVLAWRIGRFGPGHPWTVGVRASLAEVCRQLGDEAGSERQLGSMIAALRAQGAYDDGNLVGALAALAAIEAGRGQQDSAWAHTAEAQAWLAQMPAPSSVVRSQLAGAQVASLLGAGAWARADSVSQAEVDRLRAERQLGTDMGREALLQRVRVLRAGGQGAKALAVAIEACTLAQAQLVRNVHALPEREALALAAAWSEPLDTVLAVADPRDPQAQAGVFEQVLRWRGTVRRELQRRRLPASASENPMVVEAARLWRARQSVVARLEVRDAASGVADPAQHEAAQRDADEAERSLAAMLAGGVPSAEAPSLAVLQAGLPPGSALVSLVETLGTGAGSRVIGWVLRPGAGPPARLDLGPASELRARADDWFATVSRSPAVNAAALRRAESESRQTGLRLREAAWDPIAAAVGDADPVFIVPAGPLEQMEWDALPDDATGYRVDHAPLIHVLDDEEQLLHLRLAPATGALLAVGGADYDLAPGPDATAEPLALALRSGLSPCGGMQHLAALPGTAIEADHVSRLWVGASRNRALLLTGAGADERAFKAAAAHATWMHLATHGVLAGVECGAPTQGLRGVGGLGSLASGRAARTRAKTSPATAPPAGSEAWLALAGANRSATAPDENDGWLTAREIVTLDLGGTPVVVLSACHAGAGTPLPWEGALGLRRAFQLAGARTVIASRWPLGDEAALRWMEGFYAADPGTTICERIRATERSVLDQRRRAGASTHPFYWGGFTASGD